MWGMVYGIVLPTLLIIHNYTIHPIHVCCAFLYRCFLKTIRWTPLAVIVHLLCWQ